MNTSVLQLGDGLALPIDAVTRTAAVVGQKGTGKTSTAVVMLEEASAAGARFAVMDPTGAWSGLRTSADGDGPGLDCVVMGGFHGDVPLDPGAGEVVARLVVEEGYSVVCDLERMPKSDQVRFVADFSENAFHLCRSAVTVVYDESPRFVPQSGASIGTKRDGEDEGARCRAAVTDIVMLGRRKGLGSVLISQRPSKLHKDVLEQADVLIAHRLMGVNDRKAIAGWLEDAADEPSAILEQVPRLDRGQAVVIAPEYQVAGVFAIRAKRTFDSSATPDVGAVILDAPRGRAEIDLTDLEAKMGHALEAAQENDPEALRRRIRKLEQKLRDGDAGASDEDLAASYERGWKAGSEDAHGQARVVFEALESHAASALDEIRNQVDKWVLSTKDERVRAQAASVGAASGLSKPSPVPPARVEAASEPEHLTHAAGATPAPPRPAPANGTGPSLKAGAKRMLVSLLAAPRPLARSELMTLADVRGGTFSDYLSALRQHGLVDAEHGDLRIPAEKHRLALDITGYDVPPLALSPDQVAAPHVAKLKAGARRMLDALMRAHPEGFTRAELSRLADVRGGTFSDYLSALRKRGLVEERARRLYAGHILYLWDERS